MSQNLKDEDSSLSTWTEKKKPSILFSRKRLIYIISIVIGFVICYLVVGFLFINKSISDKELSANSIAVLPFKDFSPEDSQWFSDGVSDNILHSLAQMKQMRVISFTSSSTYRDTDKQIPQIADELNVSYILEGSVTLVDDKIKIIAQLIDSNDTHLWSKEYEESFDDIITVQNNVVREVMKQLEVTLSLQEEIILSKYPTENMEAYNLYLRGKSYRNPWIFKDLQKRIELNSQAIALDSNFVEPYVEIAIVNLLLQEKFSSIIDPFDARDQATYFTNKALKIDPNNSEAWSAKAAFYSYVDWEKTKEYSEKAIKLNPSNSVAHIVYAYYYRYGPKPDNKKALANFRSAYELDPLSFENAGNLVIDLILNHKIKEAEILNEKTKYMWSQWEFVDIYTQDAILAFKNKDWTTVIPIKKDLIKNHPNKSLYYRLLADDYDQIMNDKVSAIAYAKKAFDLDSTDFSNTGKYLMFLIEDKKFKKAKKILESENFTSIASRKVQLHLLWHYYYYYYQEKHDKALEVLKDSIYKNQYTRLTYTYAQIGDRKKVDSMNKRFPWGTGFLIDYHARRAIIYGILKDKDSMYLKLEQINNEEWARKANRQPVFNPYRDEKRFKNFQKKWYLPVSGE